MHALLRGHICIGSKHLRFPTTPDALAPGFNCEPVVFDLCFDARRTHTTPASAPAWCALRPACTGHFWRPLAVSHLHPRCTAQCSSDACRTGGPVALAMGCAGSPWQPPGWKPGEAQPAWPDRERCAWLRRARAATGCWTRASTPSGLLGRSPPATRTTPRAPSRAAGPCPEAPAGTCTLALQTLPALLLLKCKL